MARYRSPPHSSFWKFPSLPRSLSIARSAVAMAAMSAMMFTPRTLLSADLGEPWASKALESFETYCYHPFGKYSQIESLANLTKLRPLPNFIFAAMLGPKSTEGKGYFVESDKGAGMYILLGLAKPDACSIYVQGVPYVQVKLRLESSYKLVFAGRDDMGQQLSEMYVPGGKTGDKKEAIELGLILVTYPKQELSADGFTLGYLPPGTVEGLLHR